MISKLVATGLLSCLAAVTLIWIAPATALASSRDHLTAKEADLIRDAQALDERTAIFIAAAERRLSILKAAPTTGLKQSAREIEKWGEIPPGTRAELLMDIARILDEAINNIDDVSGRDARNPLIPKALRKLAGASEHFLAELKPMIAQAQDKDESEALAQAMENSQAVLDAAKRLSKETNSQ